MVPCLSHFPSLCLEAICKFIPLVELIQSLGWVCTSFHEAQHTDLNRRRRLVLVREDHTMEDEFADPLDRDFIFSPHETTLIERVRREDGSPWERPLESLEQFQFDELIAPEAFWTAARIDPSPLIHLSNITQLVLIVQGNPVSIPQVARIIDHYSHQLVDLKMRLWKDHINSDLFDALDRCGSLRHLRMHFATGLSVRPRLTFLGRLESFAIDIVIGIGRYDGVDWMLDQLSAHHGNGTIELHNKVQVQHLLTRVNPLLNGYFRSMTVSFDTIGITRVANAQLPDDFERFCSRFLGLTKLSLKNDFMPIPVLASSLSQLPNLVDFALLMPYDPEGKLLQPLDQQEPLARVPSVRLLFVEFTSHSHHDTELLFIPEIFVNVQVLRLRQIVAQCADCGLGNHLGNSNLDPPVIECKRLSRQVFRRCAHLHTVQPDKNSDRLIAAEEL